LKITAALAMNKMQIQSLEKTLPALLKLKHVALPMPEKLSLSILFKTSFLCFFSIPSICMSSCYTVTNSAEEVVYRSGDAPVDLSKPISNGLASKYPGGHLVITDEYFCPPLEDKNDFSVKNVNYGIKERVTHTRPGKVEELHGVKQPDSTNR